MNDLIGETLKTSFVYESPPWGFEHPSRFLNQAVKIRTGLSALELLKNILDIEETLGRLRRKDTYEARTIDIDMLFFNDMVIQKKILIIPHPRLHLRRFALLPLADLDPELIHPLMGKSIVELITACPDKSNVVRYTHDESSYTAEGCKNAV
jgi:2-amino-4-hydroxy-6-hydroxymethyldihydropteridine diphosphokinase